MNFRQYTKFEQLISDIFQICSFKKKIAHNQTCSSIQGAQQGTQITVESFFISRFTMNNIAPKLQNCWVQNCLQYHYKNAKRTKFILQ